VQREKLKHRYKKGEGDKPELKKRTVKIRKKVANFPNADHFDNLVGEASRSEFCQLHQKKIPDMPPPP